MAGNLGRTGERVSAIGVDGWHLALPQVEEKPALHPDLVELSDRGFY